MEYSKFSSEFATSLPLGKLTLIKLTDPEVKIPITYLSNKTRGQDQNDYEKWLVEILAGVWQPKIVTGDAWTPGNLKFFWKTGTSFNTKIENGLKSNL